MSRENYKALMQKVAQDIMIGRNVVLDRTKLDLTAEQEEHLDDYLEANHIDVK